ncbi:MAG: acylphosphatase [Chloroflexi bacterium]|nr:acylphosphatase [Chloroflexota bacterium]
MGAEASERLHAVVEGQVQRVGFRYFVLENAMELGLTGWVRNRWDGSVETTAEGPRPALEKLAALLRRGPLPAYVTGVNPEWQAATGEFTGFHLKSTE